MSNENANLFTPAGYAFSIWGIIFLGMIVLSLFCIIKNTGSSLMRNNFVYANICNALWVVAFTYEYFFLALIIMLCILIFLHRIILQIIKSEHKPSLFITIPISLYAGWISVATIANSSFYLKYIGWNGSPFSESIWAVIMVSIAGILYAYMIRKHALITYTGVGVWALTAIAVRYAEVKNVIYYAALLITIALVITVLYTVFERRKTSLHPSP